MNLSFQKFPPVPKICSVMTPITISSLTQLSREQLADLLSASPSSLPSRTDQKIAVVDVRDSDRIGGHIRSSIWVPSHTLDMRMPELLRTLREKDKVVFHCALSQQRGPAAALRYARERREMREREDQQQQQKSGSEARDGEEVDEQEVCVLEGGFSMWQAKYGEDQSLTEAYVKDIWDE